MDPITPRNRSRSVEPDVYWRRRLFALAAGLAVFGLLAWAVGGTTTTRQTASTTPLTSQSPQVNVTPVSASPASPSPSPSVTSPSPSPSGSPSPTGSPGSQQKHGKKPAGNAARAGRPHAKHAAAAAKARPHGSGCPAGAVVITMTASSNSYGARARPEFSVDLVSTDSRTCTLNTGSRHLAVVIESGGVRVWGSADCAGKSGASVTTKLKRGVPLQLRFTWDRLLSAPGCRGAQTPARPGTYTVTVSDGPLRSRTLAFVLR
jgi:hypothetical protein